MYDFKNVRVVITKENNVFKVEWFRLQKVEVPCGFKNQDIVYKKIDKWVPDGQVFKATDWMQIQVYLDENVSLEDVFIMNRTEETVNYHEIAISGRRYY